VGAGVPAVYCGKYLRKKSCSLEPEVKISYIRPTLIQLISWLKKAGADPMYVKNYRAIPNLTFMSKVVESVVCRQLMSYL